MFGLVKGAHHVGNYQAVPFGIVKEESEDVDKENRILAGKNAKSKEAKQAKQNLHYTKYCLFARKEELENKDQILRRDPSFLLSEMFNNHEFLYALKKKKEEKYHDSGESSSVNSAPTPLSQSPMSILSSSYSSIRSCQSTSPDFLTASKNELWYISYNANKLNTHKFRSLLETVNPNLKDIKTGNTPLHYVFYNFLHLKRETLCINENSLLPLYEFIDQYESLVKIVIYFMKAGVILDVKNNLGETPFCIFYKYNCPTPLTDFTCDEALIHFGFLADNVIDHVMNSISYKSYLRDEDMFLHVGSSFFSMSICEFQITKFTIKENNDFSKFPLKIREIYKDNIEKIENLLKQFSEREDNRLIYMDAPMSWCKLDEELILKQELWTYCDNAFDTDASEFLKLFKKGVDINACIPGLRNTPLHMIFQKLKLFDAKKLVYNSNNVIDFKEEDKLIVDKINIDKVINFFEIIYYFIKYGADINAKNHFNNTPFDVLQAIYFKLIQTNNIKIELYENSLDFFYKLIHDRHLILGYLFEPANREFLNSLNDLKFQLAKGEINMNDIIVKARNGVIFVHHMGNGNFERIDDNGARLDEAIRNESYFDERAVGEDSTYFPSALEDSDWEDVTSDL